MECAKREHARDRYPAWSFARKVRDNQRRDHRKKIQRAGVEQAEGRGRWHGSPGLMHQPQVDGRVQEEIVKIAVSRVQRVT